MRSSYQSSVISGQRNRFWLVALGYWLVMASVIFMLSLSPLFAQTSPAADKKAKQKDSQRAKQMTAQPAPPADTSGADAQHASMSGAIVGGPVVIRGGKLLTVSHGTIENGAVVIENGKITQVGPAASVRVPANAKVIDATGMTVYPGLIDAESRLGLTEISADEMTNDLLEPSDNIMPHMRTADAFHAESEIIPVTRVNGITNAIIAPENRDTLPGQDSFISLFGKSADDMLMIRDIAMPLNFTGDQRKTGGGRRGGGGGGLTGSYPVTRMGMAAQLRQVFMDAQDYTRKQDEYAKKKDDPKATAPKRDLKLEALVPYLQGKKTVIIAADESNDVETAVHLAQEFGLKFVLNHVTHAQRVLDYIASLKVPVIVGPIYEEPKDDERYDTVYRLPAELQKRGVRIAFASYDSHNTRNLPYEAGFAVAWGLPYDEALRAITLTPAEIFGVADRLGSLDVGKLGNVVVANGDPLDVKTDVKHVFVNGAEVPLTNKQIRLRDEYMK
jgi:imidazolonepropionase-like amidohydrolase